MNVTNINHSQTILTGQRVYLSTLVLAVIAIAGVVFALHFYFSPTFIVGKYSIEILTGYGIASALSVIVLLSLIIQKTHKTSKSATEIPVKTEEPEKELFLEESQLNKLDSLKEEENTVFVEQARQLRSQAKQILNKGSLYPAATDWHQFALMHNTSLIKNSSYEGYQKYHCLNAYIKYLTFLQHEKSFFAFEDAEQIFLNLQDVLTTSKNLLVCFPFARKDNMPSQELHRISVHLLNMINQELKNKGYIYLPIGYCGWEHGHALVCKISLDLNHSSISIAFLNLGAGVENHPELAAANTHIKSSYSYYPAVLSLDTWNRISQGLIAHLLRFISDLPPKDKSYTSQQLYDLLGVLQSFSLDDILKNASKLEAKPQHVGDCPEKAVRNIIHDFLVMIHNVSQQQHDKVFLNLHFTSIITAYHDYCHNPQEDRKELLINACEEFSCILLRSKSSISEEEFLEAAETIDLILQRVKIQPVNPTAATFSRSLCASTLFPKIDMPEILNIDQLKQEKPAEQQAELFPTINPKRFKDDLQHIIDLNKHHYGLFKRYTLTLPIPQWGKEDVWDEIPQEDILDILKQMQALVTSFSSIDASDQMLFVCTLYAIADKLGRRIDAKQEFHQIAFPFPMHLEQYLFFPIGLENKRFKEIITYFSHSLHAAGGKMIPFPKTLANLSDALAVLLHFACLVMDTQRPKNTLDEEELSWEKMMHSLGNPKHSSSLDYRLMRFYAQHQTFSTNAVLCTPKNYEALNDWDLKEINADLMNELLLLVRSAAIKPGLVIPWIQTNLHELEKDTVQLTIEYCLFAGDTLASHIYHNPEIVNELRTLIEKSLLHYSNNYDNYKSILFLIRCGITLESHLAAILNTPIDIQRIKKYQENLNTLQSLIKFEGNKPDEDVLYIHILAHQQFVTYFIPIDTADAFIDVFTHVFKFGVITYGSNSSFNIPTSLLQRLSCFQNNFLKQLQDFLEKQNGNQQQVLNTICNGIIRNVVKIDTATSSWNLSPGFSTSVSKDFSIDFIGGTIRHAQYGYPLIQTYQSERENIHYNEFGLDPTQPWWIAHTEGSNSQSLYVSLDESTIFAPRHDYPHLLKSKGVISSKSWVFFKNKDYKTLPFLHAFSLIHMFVKEKNSGFILSCFRKTHIPFMRIDLTSAGVLVSRVDAQGNILPYKLVNLADLAPSHPLYAYTLYFDRPKNILCFIDEKTQEIEELYFKDLELNFFRNGQNKLESKEFPGFCLVPLKVKALKSLSRYAMILCNDEGKIKVILPIPRREEKKLGHCHFLKQKTLDAMEKRYFCFDLGSPESSLQCKSFTEKLFLIYFFKSHGDLKTAYSELKQLRVLHFDKASLKILELFLALKDHTPLSLAFTQKLILYCTDHYHLLHGYETETQIIEKEYTQKNQFALEPSREHKKKTYSEKVAIFLNHTISWYVNYLRALGDDHTPTIPIEWRLTEDEERRILAVLQREKVELPKVLKIRSELLLAKSRSAEVEFTPQEINLVPYCYTKIVPPSKWTVLKRPLTQHDDLPYGKKRANKTTKPLIAFPNWISSKYCIHNFVELYEQARNVTANGKPDCFDFTLLAILRSVKSPQEKAYSVDRELASILFYVRKFPSFFKGLTLKGKNDQDAKLVFNQILFRVSLVEMVPEAQQIIDVKEKKVSFPYSKKMTLKLPEKPSQEAPSPLPEIEPLQIVKKPFHQYCKELFIPSNGPASYGKEKLFEPALLENHPLEKEIIAHYEKAHKQLAEQNTVSYKVQTANFAHITQELQIKKQEYQELIVKEKKRLDACVNDPFNAFQGDFTLAQQREFRLRQNAHQTYIITAEMIMQEAILKNTTKLFDEHRPMLQTKHIQALIEAVHRYYHLLVLSALCSEALELIEKIEKDPNNVILEQQLFDILSYEFLYAPEQFPEIAYMKVKTGKLPRKQQAIVYQWVCEGLERNENRLFQLPAGGGKTSYLIPLMILRCKRLHHVPFVFSTEAMYGIEKENLSATLTQLGIELDTLEIRMHSKLALENLQIIYQQFVSILQQDKAVIITPQAYYALRLKYFTAVIQKEQQTADLLQSILSFIHKRCVMLGDESHRICDPMTQAIFGLGNFVSLSHKEQSLLFALTKPLLGFETLICKNGKKLSDIARSKENGKGKPSKHEIQFIQKELAEHILSTFFVDIPKSKHPEIIKFWLEKKSEEPPYLANLNEDQRYLVVFARYFFLSLLKQALKMQTDFDHVYSAEQGGIDTPSYYKTPSHAQFKDPYLTFLLTLKGTWQRGLSESQFRVLITHLKKQDAHEQSLALNIAETPPSQARFKKWVSTQFPTVTLQNFDMINETQFQELYACLCKQPDVVEYFLSALVLKHVGYSSEQFTSTPAHLMDGFKCCVLFSATPLQRLAYPKALQAMRTDELFETQVTAQSAKSKNQNFIFPENVDAFFAHLKTQLQKYAHVRQMIDAGGFLCHETNEDVAQKWLDASDLDGVIFFKHLADTYEEKPYLRLRNPASELAFNSMAELKQILHQNHKLQIDQLKIGVFFDAARAESAHFDPEPKTAAIIFAGDALTLSHAIQGIMRQRGFLNEAIDQQIIWVVQKDLKAKMQGKCSKFTSGIIHSWCLKNEVKAKKTQIMMAAFQEITFKIEQFSMLSSENLQACIQQHAQGFKDIVNPQASWGSKKKLEKSEIVLWEFAKSHYERFGFPIPFDENHALKRQIQATIEAVQHKISHIFINFQTTAVSEMHQKCVVKKHVRTIQYHNELKDVIPAAIVKHVKISDPHYPEAMAQNLVSFQAVFNTPRLTQNFYMESNQIDTALKEGMPLKEKFLKTVDFILVVIHQNKVWAEAISNDMLPKYLKHLQNCPDDQAIQHQAFIIRSDGVIYQKGTGALTPSAATVNQVMHSEWMQDVLIDAALLKLKILYCDRFKARIKQWPDFPELLNKIGHALPLKKEISVNAILAYLPSELGEALVNNINI